MERGQLVEVLRPGQPVRTFEMGEMVHVETGEHVAVADRTPEAYACETPFPLEPGDILRREIEPKERRCG